MKMTLFSLAVVVLCTGFNLTTAYANAPQPDRQSQSREETFAGEVTRNPDNRNLVDEFILYDEVRKTNYFLDDYVKVEKYDGQKVEITGTLDQRNETVHVESIKVLE